MNEHQHEPRVMNFGNECEMSYSVLWNGYATEEAAKAARDGMYRDLSASGHKASRSTLRGQVRQYWSMGNPCGDSCTVYRVRWVHIHKMPED